MDPETERAEDWESDETGLPPLPAIDAGDDAVGTPVEPPAEEAPPPPPADPREVIEPLDYGDPEIVIEGPSQAPDPESGAEEPPPLPSQPAPLSSAPGEGTGEGTVESIFELEDDGDDEDDEEFDRIEDRGAETADHGDGAPPAPEPDAVDSISTPVPRPQLQPRGSGEEDDIFHFDEKGPENVFELDEEKGGENEEKETASEREEVDEVRGSGPFYF